MRPWLIGENNPYSSDPYYALYPEPEQSAGHRLCVKIFGMRESRYLRTFERRNLLHRQHGWSVGSAKTAAAQILTESDGAPLVLCGVKVANAFGVSPEPFRVLSVVPDLVPQLFKKQTTVVVLPHPSGLCRVWNEPNAIVRARAAVRQVLDDDALGSRERTYTRDDGHEHEFEYGDFCVLCKAERCENCHTLHEPGSRVCRECGPRR